MKIETPYGDVTPETVWGSCPGPNCTDVELEWHEEGPICPDCGHLWDHNGSDIGSWDENMGEPWAESKANRDFRKAEETRRAWWKDIHDKARSRT